MIDNKFVLFSGLTLFINGLLHVIVGILAIGILDLCVTAFIFSGFFIPIGLKMIQLVKNNLLDETSPMIIASATISFLNSITILTHVITATPEDRLYLYILLIIIIIINCFSFPIVFKKKTELDQMAANEKLSYLSIIIIRGLGLGLLFNVLDWIGFSNEFNPLMIYYILVFGILYIFFGNKLYKQKEIIKIQIWALLMLILGLMLGIILCLLYPNPKFIVNTILFCGLIPIRIYYIKKKF
ncbi:MAG: hypothetical protein ACTSRI_00800 [Promethearchaeota archaeon]